MMALGAVGIISVVGNAFPNKVAKLTQLCAFFSCIRRHTIFSRDWSSDVCSSDLEWLWQYCQSVEERMHFDYYIFGHRHLPLELPVGERATYINLGEWVSQYHYGDFDGETFRLDRKSVV